MSVCHTRRDTSNCIHYVLNMHIDIEPEVEQCEAAHSSVVAVGLITIDKAVFIATDLEK